MTAARGKRPVDSVRRPTDVGSSTFGCQEVVMKRLQQLLETSPLTKAALWGMAAMGMVGGGFALTQDDTQASWCDCDGSCGQQEQCLSGCIPPGGTELWGKCTFVC
jgi:hypothetical protein